MIHYFQSSQEGVFSFRSIGFEKKTNSPASWCADGSWDRNHFLRWRPKQELWHGKIFSPAWVVNIHKIDCVYVFQVLNANFINRVAYLSLQYAVDIAGGVIAHQAGGHNSSQDLCSCREVAAARGDLWRLVCRIYRRTNCMMPLPTILRSKVGISKASGPRRLRSSRQGMATESWFRARRVVNFPTRFGFYLNWWILCNVWQMSAEVNGIFWFGWRAFASAF